MVSIMQFCSPRSNLCHNLSRFCGKKTTNLVNPYVDNMASCMLPAGYISVEITNNANGDFFPSLNNQPTD